ncbi:MAG: hypothetical protein ABW171_12140 [Steroidobacter sp.]
MQASERTLHALRAQVSFELVENAAAVARAAKVLSTASDRANESMRSSEAAAEALRMVMGQARPNPTHMTMMRRVYRAELHALHEAENDLAAAEVDEQHKRDALAELRNRERSLERAIDVDRAKRTRREQVVEMAIADDSWLHQLWREQQ